MDVASVAIPTSGRKRKGLNHAATETVSKDDTVLEEKEEKKE